MIYAIVENGIVVNIATSEHPLEPNWIQTDKAGIGWTYENGVFTPPEPKPIAMPVPKEVTPLQIRKALRRIGLYDSIISYVETQSDEVKDAWEYAISISRDDPMIHDAALYLNKTDEEIDDLFRLASSL